MKYHSALLLFLVAGAPYAQGSLPDTLVHRKNFSVSYSQEFMQPLEVWYDVKCPQNETTSKECEKERRRWISEPDVQTAMDRHYSEKWNRGHMAPVESFDCTCDDVESVMTRLNCALQDGRLNQHGPWRKLEQRELQLAESHAVSVYIRLEFNDSVRIEGALVPSGFLKVLSFDGITESYFFPNKAPVFEDLDSYRTSSDFWLGTE